MPEGISEPHHAARQGEDATRPQIDITPPEGWVSVSELGESLIPPVSADTVGAAIRELSREQRERRARLDAEAQQSAQEPDITMFARHPESHHTRIYVNPQYIGSIAARVAEIRTRE